MKGFEKEELKNQWLRTVDYSPEKVTASILMRSRVEDSVLALSNARSITRITSNTDRTGPGRRNVLMGEHWGIGGLPDRLYQALFRVRIKS